MSLRNEVTALDARKDSRTVCTYWRSRTGNHVARSRCWKTLKPSRELGSSNMERLAGNWFAEGLDKEAWRLGVGTLSRVKRNL